MKLLKIETILEVASSVFIKYGYQKTSMDDIAKEAMIGKGTIYYYFNSKEDIFLAILKNISLEINKVLESKIQKANSFEEKFKIFFTEPFKHFMSHHRLIILVWNEDSPVFLKKLYEFKIETHLYLKKILLNIFREGEKDGVLKDKFVESIDKIVDVIFKWVFIGGEYVKLDLNENSIKDIMNDYLLFCDIFINGLISKEAK